MANVPVTEELGHIVDDQGDYKHDDNGEIKEETFEKHVAFDRVELSPVTVSLLQEPLKVGRLRYYK